MVLALSTLFIVDGFQCRVSANARNSREPERSSEIRRTALGHFVARAVKFSGLLYRWIYTGKGCKFIGGFKPRNIAYFGKERGCKRRPHTHNCIEFAIKGSELFGYEILYLCDLLFQKFYLLNELPYGKRSGVGEQKRTERIFRNALVMA